MRFPLLLISYAGYMADVASAEVVTFLIVPAKARWMLMLQMITAVAILVLADSAGAETRLGTVRLDNWAYFQQNTTATERWQIKEKLFVPFHFDHGWTFTQRVDVPFYYTNKSGPANSSGDWKADISDMLIEEIIDSQEVAKNLRLRMSLRFIFPTGGQAPFGSDQWQVAPGVGFSYRLPDTLRGMTIAPFLRYFNGFDAGSGVSFVQRLDIYPALTFGFDKLRGIKIVMELFDENWPKTWSLALYPENPISYNAATGKWFVPIDAMLVYRISQRVEWGIGGAYAVVRDDSDYKYIVNTRISLYF
jgi:hypothetical protein